ncbi:MAG: N-acetyl-gamma-glutamyl-phosphate reductase [Candidatus Gracilibacteria bacterium]|jgi:N-acetyl-gamma-glutamyl-phosphate reductase
MPKTKVAIIGASGYIANELLRILLSGEDVEIVALTSESEAGKRISDFNPHLGKFCDLTLEKFSPSIWEKADVVFLALPHNVSQEFVKSLPKKCPKIIDLSADFRLQDLAVFEKFYGKHTYGEKVPEFVYGLPELHRVEIKQAKFVANSGCFATASILALKPLAEKNLITQANISGFTGSSGIGRKPVEASHHPVRNHNFKAYQIGCHRHLPEIQQETGVQNINFTPHSAPVSRGIFLSVFVNLTKEISEEELVKIYHKRYDSEPFVRVVENAELANVVGSNQCDIAVKLINKQVAHISAATDNLMKGAAGTAVQNFNLITGRSETAYLKNLLPLHP